MRDGFISKTKANLLRVIACGTPITFLIILLIAVITYFYLLFFENAIIDDAFITMRYAKTLLESGTWGFFPNHVSNSATSPLNVILLALTAFVTGSIIDAVKWLTLINFLLIFILLRKISVKSLNTEIFGFVSFASLVFNPLLLSTIGLEGILFTTLFIGSVYFYLEGKWSLLAVATGLLTLTRPEGILFFTIFLAFVPTMKSRFKLALFYLGCLAPWYIFSWIHLGSLVPDTLFIKTSQMSWGTWTFSNGLLLYCKAYPLETTLSFFCLPLAILAFNNSPKFFSFAGRVAGGGQRVHPPNFSPKEISREIDSRMIMAIIGLSGLAHFISYSLLRVPPYHWYYVPEVIGIILLGDLALADSYRYGAQTWKKRLLWALVLLYILIAASGMLYLLGRNGFYLKEMPIHTNWATHEQYKKVALWLKEHDSGQTIQARGEIGTLAFYYGCCLLNEFSDREWLKTYTNRRPIGWDIRATLLKINFIFYKHRSSFLPISSVLVGGHDHGDMLDSHQVVKWKTSTKWITDGVLTYSKISLNQPLHLVNPTEHPYVYVYIWNNGQAETYLLDDASWQGRTYNVEWTITPRNILFQGAFQAKLSSITALSPDQFLAIAVAFSDSPDRVTLHIFERRYWFKFTKDNQIEFFYPPEEWHNPQWPDESGWRRVSIDHVMTDR
ncbi:MAG: hypothetical protein JW953_17465 [Anaerolineae bacterium]|nr:hypothetical protein [Anaerolineae bacterium]